MSKFDNSTSANSAFLGSLLNSGSKDSLMPTEGEPQQKTLHKIAEILLLHVIPALPAPGAVQELTRVSYDIPIAVSGSLQEVTVSAGAWEIMAAITNQVDGPFSLSVTDSEADFETLPENVQVNRAFQATGNIVLVESLMKIRFPVGSSGIVSVTGGAGYAKPVIA